MPTSQMYQTAPTDEFHDVMAALDAWVKTNPAGTDGDPWTTTERLLSSMLRDVRYGDATCDCGSSGVDWPHQLTSDEDGASWVADYTCRSCGSTYTASWADNLFPG